MIGFRCLSLQAIFLLGASVKLRTILMVVSGVRIIKLSSDIQWKPGRQYKRTYLFKRCRLGTYFTEPTFATDLLTM